MYCVQASPFTKPDRGVSVQFDSAEASYVPSTVYKEGRSKKKKTLIIKNTPVRTWKEVSVFGKGRNVFAFYKSQGVSYESPRVGKCHRESKEWCSLTVAPSAASYYATVRFGFLKEDPGASGQCCHTSS
jgi:hypothetical protein